MTCIHPERELYTFAVPYLGEVGMCWECRREIAIRIVEKPIGLVPLDCGRIGYRCSRCDGTYTTTDAMTCKCKGRKRECRQTAKAVREWSDYQSLTNTSFRPITWAGEASKRNG